jgi:hypothetical protein
MSEIVIAKLITGETVVGKFTDSYKETLEEVFNIMMMPTAQGEMGMNIVPYMMPFTDKGTPLDSKFIVTSMDAPEELQKVYLQATSGIILPKTNSILR